MSRLRFFALAAVSIALLSACGTTIGTKKISPTASFDRLSSTLDWKVVEQQAREAFDEAGISKLIETDPSTAILTLAEWAGVDPRRLQMGSSAAIQHAERIAKRGDTLKASGYFLTAADLAYQALHLAGVPSEQWLSEPGPAASVDLYNHSLSRFIDLIGERRPAVIEAAIGRYSVTWPERRFDSVVGTSDSILVGFGKEPPLPVPGVGVALLGIGKPEKFYTPHGAITPLSGVAEFSLGAQGGRVTRDVRFFLLDQHSDDGVAFLGKSVNLEVNYAASVARAMDGLNDRRMGLGGFLFASKRYEEAGIYMIEPYDPERIPVLFSHGLQSSPLIWRTMIVELMRDEKIRENYQFWLLYYPSGIPVPMSASILRDNLADIRATYDPDSSDPVSNNMVAVGHSMGGILTRTLITDMQDVFWQELSDRPFDDLDLDAEKKEEFRNILFWSADPSVTRAVFFSAPHRGATMADGFLGRLGKKLVNLPSTVRDIYSDYVRVGKGILKNSEEESRAFNSIGSLSPDSELFKALDAAPDKEGVTYHSVIGDRGKGDTPESSDGVVAYWSSHLEEAETELIVPTGHSSYLSPLALDEMKRILREHLDD